MHENIKKVLRKFKYIYIYIFSIETLYQKRKYYIILQEKNKILKKDIT